MNFWNYITKSRKGKDAHRIELEAMKDPFLADAIEGYDLVKNEDHAMRIENIRKRIHGKTQKRVNLARTISIAASLLICIGLGSYFLLHDDNPLRKENHVAYSLDIAPSEEVIAPPPPSHAGALQQQAAPLFEDSAEQSKEMEYIQDEELVSSYILDSQRATHTLTVPEPTPLPDNSVKGEPKPTTGEKAYKEYISENLFLPAFDECGDSKGQVVVAFKVNTKGRPYDLDIKKSLCSTADMEAIRVVQEGPNWTLGDKIATVTIRF